MKIESKIVIDKDYISLAMSLLCSALSGSSLDSDSKKEFLDSAHEALLNNTQEIANKAFQMGMDFAYKNPK